MTVLHTTADYVREARLLLQDAVEPYRYPDTNIVNGLNYAMTEIARLRPEIIHEATYTRQVQRRWTANRLVVPEYCANKPCEIVDLPIQYRMATLLYVVGFAQLHDGEEVQDQRASAFVTNFIQKLLAVAA